MDASVASSIDDAPADAYGEIITFYSYKGGTGRSMVLANVAYLLAKQRTASSKRILAIDWDLEAPGLHRYFQKEVGPSVDTRPGLIDLFCDVRSFYQAHARTGVPLAERAADECESADLFREAMQAYPLEKYCVPVSGLDRLDLMTAGRQGHDYANRVRSFEWESFYLSYGSFFTHLRELLMQRYDYVLIDSRTGLTDTSGICTRVMPEKLVTVFAPNRQNIDGVVDAIRRAVKYRLESRDPRGLGVFPLASRLDASVSRLREIWWHGGADADYPVVGYQPTFEKLFREIYQLEECDLEAHFAATQVPHDSDYAYGEKIAAREHTTDRLSIGYAIANLTTRLTQLSEPWEHLPDEDAAAAKRKAEAAREAAAQQLSKSEIEGRRARRARIASIVTMGVTIAVLAFVGLRSRLKSTDEPTPETLVAEANARRQAGDTNGALMLVDEALAKDAKFPPALILRVQALLEKQDVKAAHLAFDALPHGTDASLVKYLYGSIKTEEERQAEIQASLAFDRVPDSSLGGSHTGRAALAAAVGELNRDVQARDSTAAGQYRGERVDLYNKVAGVDEGAPWATSFVLWCLEQAGWTPGDAKPKHARDLIEYARARNLFYAARAYQAHPGDLVFPTNGVTVTGGAKKKEEDSPYVAIVHHAVGSKVWAIAGSIVDKQRGDNLKRVLGVTYELSDIDGFAEIRDPPRSQNATNDKGK